MRHSSHRHDPRESEGKGKKRAKFADFDKPPERLTEEDMEWVRDGDTLRKKQERELQRESDELKEKVRREKQCSGYNSGGAPTMTYATPPTMTYATAPTVTYAAPPTVTYVIPQTTTYATRTTYHYS
jgi:hypothetical protein